MKKVLSTILLVSMLTITACSSPAATTTAGAGAGGSKTETVTVKGYKGDVVVKVTATADKIEKLEIVGKDETPALGGEAITTLSKKIVDGNTLKVDAVSGATVTSEAVVKGVTEALTKMGFDAAKFKK